MPPKRTGKKKKEEDEDAEAKKAEEEQHDWEPVVERLRPKEQLDLTEEELNQEITRVLSANNPNAPQNVIRFSNKERLFKLEPSVEQMATHFNLEGHLLHKDTDEAKRIISQAEAERDEQARKEQEIPLPINQNQQEQQEDNAKTLRNQFNFSERASQTFNNPMRERGTATEPPPSVTFSATATQWEIFDNYEQDLERQRQAKEKKPTHVGKDKTGKEEMLGGDEEESPQQQRQETNVIHSQAMNKALKSMERMVNQNTYDDIAMDYQYWEDVSDSFKEGEGTLLPLWKFYTDKAKRKHVTSICWNTEYNDLFAVGYGSYDFMRQTPGLICCWSLKNPTYPEYTFTTDSGVMCLDFHPQHSSLLAVGLYDGTVLIYDIRHRLNKPIFQSTVKTGKHTDPVWQVCWQEEDLAKNSNFFSISSDGRVSLWTMSKNELQCTDVMELKLVGIQKEGSSGSAEEGEEETSLCGLAGGTCFDFNRTSDHLFIVGTEEGKIHKCSKAYNSQYLETYEVRSLLRASANRVKGRLLKIQHTWIDGGGGDSSSSGDGGGGFGCLYSTRCVMVGKIHLTVPPDVQGPRAQTVRNSNRPGNPCIGGGGGGGSSSSSVAGGGGGGSSSSSVAGGGGGRGGGWWLSDYRKEDATRSD